MERFLTVAFVLFSCVTEARLLIVTCIVSPVSCCRGKGWDGSGSPENCAKNHLCTTMLYSMIIKEKSGVECATWLLLENQVENA